ncbi:hypothetical protein EVAR_103123_1 [Eumeta japonica]|uniref:Uncharacterized protein n=1 Tax=Eumeta variegata TaxID=151549 RepID=A0A4C1X5P0_EUMVA|nr:hypothetical protein EVAR_103123_1 [Eumeta japonica]
MTALHQSLGIIWLFQHLLKSWYGKLTTIPPPSLNISDETPLYPPGGKDLSDGGMSELIEKEELVKEPVIWLPVSLIARLYLEVLGPITSTVPPDGKAGRRRRAHLVKVALE